MQLHDLMTLSANRKFRNRLATNRSCLKSFWKRSEGRGENGRRQGLLPSTRTPPVSTGERDQRAGGPWPHSPRPARQRRSQGSGPGLRSGGAPGTPTRVRPGAAWKTAYEVGTGTRVRSPHRVPCPRPSPVTLGHLSREPPFPRLLYPQGQWHPASGSPPPPGGSPSLTPREHVPGDGVCDGREDPVQLAQGRPPVVQPAGDPRGHVASPSETVTRLSGGSGERGGQAAWGGGGRGRPRRARPLCGVRGSHAPVLTAQDSASNPRVPARGPCWHGVLPARSRGARVPCRPAPISECLRRGWRAPTAAAPMRPPPPCGPVGGHAGRR